MFGDRLSLIGAWCGDSEQPGALWECMFTLCNVETRATENVRAKATSDISVPKGMQGIYLMALGYLSDVFKVQKNRSLLGCRKHHVSAYAIK